MSDQFVLERLVHYILNDDPLPARRLIVSALQQGTDPQQLLADTLWPAAECLQQLKADDLIPTRSFNAAVRSLGALINQVAGELPRLRDGADIRGTLMLISAPGEPTDLGAQLVGSLAESLGFQVFFAGAGVSRQELTFALTQLRPDALLIHGSLPAAQAATRTLLKQLDEAQLRPGIQVALAGAIASRDGQDAADGLGADLVSRHPVEILEMLALCPDYRAPQDERQPAQSLEMLVGATLSTNYAAVQDFLRSRFPDRLSVN